MREISVENLSPDTSEFHAEPRIVQFNEKSIG